MLNMKKGCKVKNADELYEQYEKTEYGYIANVNAEKIVELFKSFIYMQEGLVFFFLEVPSNLSDEKVIKKEGLNCFHKDVYYMDNLNQKEATNFLDTFGELLANDGLSSFGFGSQHNNDEIGAGKYNVVTIFTQDRNYYDGLFQKFGIVNTEKLVTAWDTFTEETPGHSERIRIDGKDIYSLVKELKDKGLYFAEQREDN